MFAELLISNAGMECGMEWNVAIFGRNAEACKKKELLKEKLNLKFLKNINVPLKESKMSSVWKDGEIL